jgi:hypothetical protein
MAIALLGRHTCLAQTPALHVTGVKFGQLKQTGTGNAATSLVVVNWTGGTAPFQVQCRAGVADPWQDIGGIAYGSSQTNILTRVAGFYRVVSVASVIAASPDKTAPSVPTGLAAAAGSSSQVNLSWTASTDTGPSASGLKGYNVYRNGIFLEQVAAPSTSTSDVGLAPSTTNSYAVSAVDNAYNESALSSPASAATPANGNCAFSISPSNVSCAATGAVASVNVTATSGCGWTASSAVPWITITGPNQGTGNGSVTYSVAANAATSARAGTLTIAGKTLSVNQNAATASPVVSITAPANGATVSGTITLSATASDTLGVTKVEFYRDGALLGTDTGTPYTLADNTTMVANGSHSYSAKAYDTAGNSSTASNTVTVSNSTGGTPGQLQWIETMLTTRAGVTAQCNGVAADTSGNVIGVGTFNDTVNLGSTTVSYSSLNSSAFVAQYSISGSLKWLKTFGKTGNAGAAAVAIDSKANIIVVGSFSGVVDFGGQILTAYDPNATGALDMFVAKFSSAGTLLWAKQFGGGQSDQANGVAVGANDDLFIAGYIGIGNATFGTTTVTGAGMQNLAVARLTSAGAVTWARSWGNSTVTASSLAVDRANDVAVTGQFSGSTDIGGGTMAVTGNYTVFVAKYSGVDGSCRWAKAFGGSGYNAGCGIATDPTTTNIVVTGGYTGSANFGGGPTSASAGEAAFLAGYDASGNYLWAKTFGGTFAGGFSEGRAVSMDAHGNLAWVGHMGSSSWFVNGQTIIGGPYFASDWTVSGNVAPALRWFTPQVYNATSADCNAKAVALDSFGHVLTGGSFYSGTVNLGSTSITTPAGGTSGFVGQYSN